MKKSLTPNPFRNKAIAFVGSGPFPSCPNPKLPPFGATFELLNGNTYMVIAHDHNGGTSHLHAVQIKEDGTLVKGSRKMLVPSNWNAPKKRK